MISSQTSSKMQVFGPAPAFVTIFATLSTTRHLGLQLHVANKCDTHMIVTLPAWMAQTLESSSMETCTQRESE